MMRGPAGYVLFVALLIGLPLAGILMAGYNIDEYLEFPPTTHYVEHAPFSWPVFAGLAFVILLVVVPFVSRVVRENLTRPRTMMPTQTNRSRFPCWGWLSLGLGAVFWLLAWTRFTWFKPFQLYTFSPLWLCYIVVVNALTWRRTGRCMMTHNGRSFLGLFPLSAAFWWFFEYLNRFVQNWYYVSCENFTPLQYFIMATLPFSTVLPAVLSTEEWLASHPRWSAGLDRFIPVKMDNPKTAAWLTLMASAIGLILVGLFPDYLFPLLWVAPLLLLLSLQHLTARQTFFPELCNGDWRRVFRFALAALICGFFWEMWNYHSLAKWIYSVPYVDRFHLFEMPILGYAGYLPFGLECAVVAQLIRKRENDNAS